MPPAGNWLRFSCSIPPLFVLSHSLPMINTTGKLASFCTFLSPLAPSLRIHWPQFSRHSPLPPTTLPHWLLPDTDRRFVKDRTGSNLDERPLYIEYVTEQGDSCGKIKPFFPTRRRRTPGHSLVARGAQRQSLQACLPDGAMPVLCLLSLISRNSPRKLRMVYSEL
jgi:hypothetical protein